MVERALVLLMVCGCVRGSVEPAPPPPPPPAPIEVVAENLPTEPPESLAEQPATPPVEPESLVEQPATPPQPGTSKDPFNSKSVDDNREGRHIMERALTLPAPDPPGAVETTE